MARRHCPDCGEPVIRARTEAMSWQLLNPQPDPDGNVHARESNGNWYARSVKPRTPAVAPERLMMPHKATCKGRQQRAAPQPEIPPNVTRLDEWKAATAKHAAARRARRGRRLPPGITGVRWGGPRPPA